MPVDGVVAGVAVRADEPAAVDAGRRVEDALGRLDPVESRARPRPRKPRGRASRRHRPRDSGCPARRPLPVPAALQRRARLKRASTAAVPAGPLSAIEPRTRDARAMIADPLFYAAAIPAVTLMGLSKGGFAGLGLLALPLMALVVSPVQAAAIMLPILIVQDVVTVWAYRQELERPQRSPSLAPGALCGDPPRLPAGGPGLGRGREARRSASSRSCFAARRLWLEQRAAPPPTTRPRFGAASFWGVICGFTSMIAHAGGPPFQMYVLPQRLPREVFVGTGAVFFARDQLDQGAALHGARPVHAGERLDLGRPVPGRASPRRSPGSGWSAACRSSASTPSSTGCSSWSASSFSAEGVIGSAVGLSRRRC